MGYGGYSKKDWIGYSTSRKLHDKNTKTDDIYRSREINSDLDPLKFTVRESTDSKDNPNSTPTIIALDVTGSMDPVLDAMARNGMRVVCEEIYNRKPITDPHICTVGIGDVECDKYPFQATQFEADKRIFEQLEKIYLERGGGGNSHESYILAWYFAKYRTSIDSFSKRGQKGFIFTVGDEEITPGLSRENISRFMGDKQARPYTCDELFKLASMEWEIFHIIVKEGHHARSNYDKVFNSWQRVIGQRVIPLAKHEKLGEVIVSTLEMMAGKSIEETANSWDGSTSLAVKSALKEIVVDRKRSKSIEKYL